MTKVLQVFLAFSAIGLCAGQGGTLRQGKNSVSIRGVSTEVHYFPGGSGNMGRPCVLFAPGDGGWRGFAVTVAEQVSGWGFDVYGLDTKAYLESFTGRTALKESDVMADIRKLSDVVRDTRRVILIGWSEGAGLMTLAAADPKKEAYAGLVTMGLGDQNVLGWRLVDNLTYITKRHPSEPSFSALSYMPKVAPLPLVMLQSSKDEYVGYDEAKRLHSAAGQPKRFFLVQAHNHRFEGAQNEFFRRLKEAVDWMAAGQKP